MTYQINVGDCLEFARNYTGPKFHALLCDPPYHLTSIVKRFGRGNSAPAKDGVYGRSSKGFMGKTWDGGDIAFQPETWETLGELLHPGGFGMAFASSRGYHRMAVAIEDAGFVIHPSVFLWAFASGFPKATRIDTQIDKAAGLKVERGKAFNMKGGMDADGRAAEFEENGRTRVRHEPQTEQARQWANHRYGLQALKPAVEPIIVFQKPYEGRPIDSMVATGAGALNIDGARIGSEVLVEQKAGQARIGTFERSDMVTKERVGRWPANFMLDEEAARRLDKQTGISKGGFVRNQTAGARPFNNNGENTGYVTTDKIEEPDGGASRFFFNINSALDQADPVFYAAKVSTKERNAGLEDRNVHPTCKPISLTQHLATLLLPPSAYAPRRLFVPFSGSGSEMIGGILAGWDEVVGIELSQEYADIAEQRLKHWSGQKGWRKTL